VKNNTELSNQPKTNVKMIFKNLTTFTSFFGFACSAILPIRADDGVGLESRQTGPGNIPPRT
jgi:hypothetical protein